MKTQFVPINSPLYGARRGRQKGSLVVQFAVLIFVLVAILGVVDIGYMYYVKRDLQRIADIAALHAARSLTDDESQMQRACQEAGWVSVQANWPAPVAIDSENSKVICGHWEPIPGNRSLNDSGPINAAHVVLKGEAPKLLPGNWSRTVFAEAIAKNEVSVSAFQVGSQLLRFNEDALLGNVLGAVGLRAEDLRLLDSEGLANARITPSGLLALIGLDIGVGGLNLLTPDGLAELQEVTLLNLLDASVQIITDSTLAAEVNALKARLVSLGLGQVRLPVGSAQDQNGLFAFLGVARDEPLGPAMSVDIGIGDLIKTAVMLGVKESGHAVEVPQLNLLGLATAKLTVVEPPTIAIGPVGTTGYGAQIRLSLDVDSSKLLGGSLKFLFEDILGTRIRLPIHIDLLDALATLEDVQCQVQPYTMDLSIRSSLLNACVGELAENHSSARQSCDQGLGELELIKLLHAPVLSGKMHIPALQTYDDQAGLEMEQGQERSSRTNDLALGNSIDAITTNLLNLLSGVFRKPTPSSYISQEYDGPELVIDMAKAYLKESIKPNMLTYDVDTVTSLVLNGKGHPGQDGYLPPLLSSDFTIPNSIPRSCIFFTCSVSNWKDGKFSEALHTYTSDPLDLLGILGISTFTNGHRNCAGLLSALLSWNSCVEHNLLKLLGDHPMHWTNVNAGSQEILDLLNPSRNEVRCNGALCFVLKPLLAVLKPVLNGVGTLLRSVLSDVLGLELTRTDVKALSIGCSAAQLVY